MKLKNLLFLLLFFFSVKSMHSQSVVDIIVGSPDHNTLEAAILAAGLESVLDGEGPFTVFAPTDAAFALLPEGTVEALLNDIPTLTAILTYHVAGDNVLSGDLFDGQSIITVNGAAVTVTINEGGIFINDALVTADNLLADNGVVHVINAVLLPPSETTSVFDIISGSPDHNTLEAAILAAGLESVLDGEGPFTVFAPTDAAFALLPEGTVEALLNDIPTLTAILTYHVAGDNVLSGDLFDGQSIITVNGAAVTVTINEGGIFINDALVTADNLLADNGVVHVINAVLLPPSETTSVFDIISGSPDHNTLKAAILAAGLESVLDGEGPFTVFAPTDAAFAALPDGLVEALLADPQGALTDVLLYHVLGENLTSEDFEFYGNSFPYYQSLNGKTVTVRVTADAIFVNDVQIVFSDLIADNGVVHVIDAVLVAPDSTIMDVVRNSPVHTLLTTVLEAAEFSQPLDGYGPFTLFAPTDEAILALGNEVIDELLADPFGLLSDILAYHLAGDSIYSTDLFDGQEVPTLLGKPLKVRFAQEGIFINNAKIIVEDIRTDNGVVHVIDAVLIPGTTVMDIISNSPDHFLLNSVISLAGLTETLNGDGPFTIFAPTDDAILALPEATIEALVNDPDGLLRDILLYHVTGGNVLSSGLTNGQKIITLNGGEVTLTINNEGVFINNARVTMVDLVADNGVVHFIDAVLLPDTDRPTIWDVIVNSPDHNILEAAVLAAGLDEVLATAGPLTVFAPTDSAFNALPAGTIETLLSDPTGLLTDILLYHATGGDVLSGDLSNGQTIQTINGAVVTVTINTEGVFINNARVVMEDILAENGVVHVINAVLLPPVSTNDFTGLPVFDVFPNPASAFITVTGKGNILQNNKMEIINQAGQVLISQSWNGDIQSLDVSNLTPGMYLLRMSNDKNTYTRKLIRL
jgi:transforming growth factor-beta-induced protein